MTYFVYCFCLFLFIFFDVELKTEILMYEYDCFMVVESFIFYLSFVIVLYSSSVSTGETWNACVWMKRNKIKQKKKYYFATRLNDNEWICYASMNVLFNLFFDGLSFCFLVQENISHAVLFCFFHHRTLIDLFAFIVIYVTKFCK